MYMITGSPGTGDPRLSSNSSIGCSGALVPGLSVIVYSLVSITETPSWGTAIWMNKDAVAFERLSG